MNYEHLKAIRIEVRDWLTGNIYSFNTLNEAQVCFNEIKEVSNGYECDVQLLVVLDEFNNVDLREV